MSDALVFVKRKIFKHEHFAADRHMNAVSSVKCVRHTQGGLLCNKSYAVFCLAYGTCNVSFVA